MNPEIGLRERKKQRTRDTIARVALELFAERGYHATTLGDIAEAADVSTRTIFAYFPSKEDILFCDFPAMKDAFRRALADRPPGVDALEAVRNFILAVPHVEARGDLHEQQKLIVGGDETLRSHMRARMGQLEELVAAAIAQDIGADADDLRPHVVAASLMAAFEVLENKSATTSEPKTAEHVVRAIDPIITFLRGGLEALARQPDAA
jgi:AcrR family transcriptional regulator